VAARRFHEARRANEAADVLRVESHGN
jgi:hypothetical protein